MKLHKLLYYCQGWHLALNDGTSLFDDQVEAWTHGPVVAGLWADEKHGRPMSDPKPLSGDALVTVDYVVERYGRLSGRDLRELSHAEDPWRDATATDADGWTTSSPPITNAALQHWFETDDELLRRNEQVKAHRRDVFDLGGPTPPSLVAAALGR